MDKALKLTIDAVAQAARGRPGRQAQRRLATTLEQAYQQIDAAFADGALSLTDFYEALYDRFTDEPAPSPLRLATRKIAQHIDAGRDGTAQFAYHNPAHIAKVGLGVAALGGRQFLSPAMHDLGHNGIGNTVDGRHLPFRLEQQAIDTATAVIGPDLSAVPTVRNALDEVYGTDVSGKVSPARVLRQVHDHVYGTGALPVILKQYPARFVTLLSDPHRMLASARLHDADVLASVISERQHRLESQRIAAEAGREATPAASTFFLTDLLGGQLTTAKAKALTAPIFDRLLAPSQASIIKKAVPRPPVVLIRRKSPPVATL